MPDRRSWLTIAETAEHFGLARKTVYSLVGRHRLPTGTVVRLGRAIRINITALERGLAMKGNQK